MLNLNFFEEIYQKKEEIRNFPVISIVKGEFQNDIENNKKCKVNFFQKEVEI